ncbi:MAG: ABC transporter ATP-binding protein [Caldimonas sp.]
MLSVRLAQGAPIALDVGLHCDSGELVALVGPSGSGKTSVLRAIAGLMRVAEGRVSLGEEVWLDTALGVEVAAERRPVGMVFQHYALFPHLSALQNVCLALPHGVAPETAGQLLTDMQLANLAHRLPHELSGGQRQRVALARALARSPKLLLLDEAFSAVDQPTRQALYEELVKLRERISIPIVMVTHDLREARLLADRLCILERGVTLQDGAPEQVMSRPRNARVAALVGLRDVHSGIFRKAADAKSPAVLRWGDAEGVDLLTVDKGRLDDGTPVRWVIAGEYVHLHLQHPVGGVNVVPCVIERMHRLGEITTLSCRALAPPEALVHLQITTRQAREWGIADRRPVFLELDPQGIHIMPARSGATT